MPDDATVNEPTQSGDGPPPPVPDLPPAPPSPAQPPVPPPPTPTEQTPAAPPPLFSPPGAPPAPPPAGYGAAPPPMPPQQFAAPPGPPKKRRTGLWVGIGAGVVVLAAAVAAVLIFYRPSFEVTAIEAPADVVAGAEVILTVDVRNAGLRAGELELTVLVDGRPAQTSVVEVAAGAEERTRIVLRDLPAGTHRLTLAEWEDLAESVWVMTPAQIVVDYLVVDPSPIDVRSQTEATVLVGVSNLGEAPGSYDLDLLLDGERADGRGIDVAGGELMEESFTITVDSPGDHEVTVGDVTESFRAHSLRRPDNGDQLVNSIGGGSNQLRITNNDDRDLLIVLAAPGDDEDALLRVYVRAGGSTTVNRLRSGTYTTYYMFGSGWCTHFEQFTEQVSAGRFEENAAFESSASHYTTYTLEMGISGGEGAPTEYLPPDDIPS